MEEEFYFESVHIHPNRLYSQILDNLNKAAINGYSHTEIGDRLKAAWIGEPGQVRIYDNAQDCAILFRQYCLDHNLLDFSLQVELFVNQLWPYPICREYLMDKYSHLFVDNLEEDTPVSHDLLREWVPESDSVLLIFDRSAGYRRFLGADPDSAYRLKDICNERKLFNQSFVTSEKVSAIETFFGNALNRESVELKDRSDIPLAIHFPQKIIRYYPEMLDWVASQVDTLIKTDIESGEIVILAPFLSDSLRFSLTERLSNLNIPTRSHRPSRALRDETATQSLLTLAAFAHPNWGLNINEIDIARSLFHTIDIIDLIRAQLLSEYVYRSSDGKVDLLSFDQVSPEVQERITYLIGNRYERLRNWLYEYRLQPVEELDHFISRLFGEVLSQPGYKFHNDHNTGQITANLIESVQKFRWVAEDTLIKEKIPVGKEYINMVKHGVIAAQYIQNWQHKSSDSVFLAPAYTFLMANQPVDFQFWLDVGSHGWYERLYQPLTHPYVLNRDWPKDKPWSHIEELAVGQDTLYRLMVGLIRRCRKGIFMGYSEYSEHGYEQRGQLLKLANRALRETSN
jgi:superfamily I DNA/RNA helicase